MSLNSGILSDALKIARVTLVFKSGSAEVGDYGQYQFFLVFLKCLNGSCITVYTNMQ